MLRWKWVLAIGLLMGCGNPNDGGTSASDVNLKAGKADSLYDEVSDPFYVPLSCSEPATGHDPNGIHDLGQGAHFEGWYYRATDPESDTSWLVIAAYWKDADQKTRAFVEVIEGPDGATYKRVLEDIDLAAIQKGAGEFSVELDDLWLSADAVSGTFTADTGEVVSIDLSVDACAYWGNPFTDTNRWTMGWVTESQGVPLRWHVHHLKGEASGVIRIDDEERILNGYALHQEKNWGVAFPSSWIWFQSNVFEDRPDVAFAAAGGPIFSFPWSPEGYMAGLRWKDRFFTWRTQDGNRFPVADFEVDTSSSEGVWRFVAEGWLHRIEVRVRVPLDELVAIDIPTAEGLEIGAVEHLAARLEIDLFERSGLGWSRVDTMVSKKAAVEAGGTLAREAGLIP